MGSVEILVTMVMWALKVAGGIFSIACYFVVFFSFSFFINFSFPPGVNATCSEDVRTPATCGSSGQLGFTLKSILGYCTGIIVKVESAPSQKIRTACTSACVSVSACKYMYSMPLQVVCLTVRMWIAWATGSITLFFVCWDACGKHRRQQSWCRSSKEIQISLLGSEVAGWETALVSSCQDFSFS